MDKIDLLKDYKLLDWYARTILMEQDYFKKFGDGTLFMWIDNIGEKIIICRSKDIVFPEIPRWKQLKFNI